MIVKQIKSLIVLSILFIFHRMPIKRNKVLLFSYYGAQYGCNPKYITDYLLQHYPKDLFDIVWAFNDPKSKITDNKIRKVKTMSIKYFYELSTAQVIITNFRTTERFVKRKGQYYIQTWHSSLRLKQIEKDTENNLSDAYIQTAKKDSLKCDLVLSGCEYSTKIFKKAFWYDGEIFEHGTPRNDILLQRYGPKRKEILNKLQIPYDIKTLLYAPTFRKGNNLSVYNLNYNVLTKTLHQKFGGKWLILVKFHPHMLSKSRELVDEKDVLNVTSYDDMQELLLVADILITDYSSLMFDYAITKRPCFLFVPDLKEYQSKERGFYFELKELPFIQATSNEDLQTKIATYNAANYKKNMTSFLGEIGSYEEGKASEYVGKRIEKVCFDVERAETDEAV